MIPLPQLHSFPAIHRGAMIVFHYERDGRVCILLTAQGCLVRYHCRICSLLHDDMQSRDACERSHGEPVQHRSWNDTLYPGPETEEERRMRQGIRF